MDASSPLSLVYVHPIHMWQDLHLLFHQQHIKTQQPITYQGIASRPHGLDRLCPQSTDDLMHHLIDPMIAQILFYITWPLCLLYLYLAQALSTS
jgi:hypothetical protein